MKLTLPNSIIIFPTFYEINKNIKFNEKFYQSLKEFVFSYLKNLEKIGYQASYKVDENLLTKSVLHLLKLSNFESIFLINF